ncbi:MAG: hypothetical protein AB7L17_00525 [Ilumatobacteraceae bacterium]
MNVDLEDRLRQALDHRAESTVLTDVLPAPGSQWMPLGDDTMRVQRPRRLVPLLAIAGALGVIVVALGIVGSIRLEPASPLDVPATSVPDSSTPDSTVLTDAHEISLDSHRTTADPPGGTGPAFVVLDVDELPPDWTAVEDGFTRLEVAGGGFLYSVSLRAPDSRQFEVKVSKGAPPMYPPVPGDGSGDVGGSPVATIGPRSIQWSPSDDTTISIEASMRNPTFTTPALLELARALRFTTATRLPTHDDPPEGSSPYFPPSEAVQLGGTLAGVRWSAQVERSALRGMSVRVGGLMSSAFSNDRLSQPEDVPVSTVEVTIDGQPDLGAIVYGYGPPESAILRAVLSDGSTIDIPTYQRDLEAYFAIPIPDGVVVDTLMLIDADGNVVASGVLPTIPRQLGGAYSGAGVFTMT